MKRDERGFALIAVLLVLAMLGIVGAEFAYSMRLEASAMRSWRDNLAAAHLAEAGVEQALRELAADFAVVALADDGLLTFYKTGGAVAVPRLPRTRVPLAPGEFSYRITDEQARINVNRLQSNPGRLDKLLQCLGIDKSVRDPIVDSILDWIDTNEEHRLSGAESDDYYLKLATPYRARNGPLESLNELLQIKGVTPAIFNGADGKPGLADVLTTRSPNPDQLNINTVAPLTLCGLAVLDAQISEIVGHRRLTPYIPTTMPTNLPAGVSFGVTSRLFRIDAEGLIDGRPRASVTALVERRTLPGSTASQLVILEWSGVR
jgi:general secretion pathway protein K